jgi:hypothetical protein
MFSLLAPPSVPGPAGKNPNEATEESFAPIRPGLGFVIPAAVLGKEWEIVGVPSDEVADLLLGEIEGGVGGGHWGFCVGDDGGQTRSR